MLRRHSGLSLSALSALAAAGLLAAASVHAQVLPPSGPGQFKPFTAPSNRSKPSDTGVRVHTNIEPMKLTGVRPMVNSPPNPPFSFYYETPASVACVYRFVTPANGCNPLTFFTEKSGGSKVIAIVDAFDYATAASDLNAFITQFGLPSVNFKVIYAGANTSGSTFTCHTGGTPPSSGSGTGWDLEAALDIVWAHAMAPGAAIDLVEANSNSFTDMFNGVGVATACTEAAGGGDVSMSWGGGEFPGETSFDSFFSGPHTTYFAAAGDFAGTIYPSTSPGVLSIGGTTFARNCPSPSASGGCGSSAQAGSFMGEDVWSDNAYFFWGTGGGPSYFESVPSWQNRAGINAQTGGVGRATPDFAALADPLSGAWVYNTTFNGTGTWYVIGGTSLATPMMAGLFNSSIGSSLGFVSPTAYNILLTSTGAASSSYPNFMNDIVGGSCGFFGESFFPVSTDSSTPYDMCNGLGSLHGSH